MCAAFCDQDSFENHFDRGQTQLVWEWIPADLETPVSAYLKLCGSEEYKFLLESVEGGAMLGRYSIIGFAPDTVLRFETSTPAVLQNLKQHVAESRIDIVPDDLPPMAVSGLFGYIGYGMIRLIEDIPDRHQNTDKIPEGLLIRPTILAIFDNVKNMICLVTAVYAHAKNSKSPAQIIFEEARQRIVNAKNKLSKPLGEQLLNYESRLSLPLARTSNTKLAAFNDAVKKAIDYIRQGEIFQAVLAQRFSIDFDLPPFALYRSLRRLNPSPFLFHLELGDFALVGSSPEILVRVRNGTVTIRPIAGTRKRGTTSEEDRALAEDLLADEKERAEHLMLLDLGRNDVGRVSEFGSVKVTEQFQIEKYSHVMHIVSNVEGQLKKDLDIVDAFFSGFPAGTVSGAPKVRAMEIIDELESGRRGYYGGGVGYFSGNNTLDTCIALRTALVKDGKVHVQAGAGVVADSLPESEFQETVNKAEAIIRAAEMAIEQAQSANLQTSHPKRAPQAAG